jgi:hypothetical protein
MKDALEGYLSTLRIEPKPSLRPQNGLTFRASFRQQMFLKLMTAECVAATRLPQLLHRCDWPVKTVGETIGNS